MLEIVRNQWRVIERECTAMLIECVIGTRAGNRLPQQKAASCNSGFISNEMARGHSSTHVHGINRNGVMKRRETREETRNRRLPLRQKLRRPGIAVALASRIAA